MLDLLIEDNFSCVLNSTAILDAIRSRECEILFEFQVKSRLVALPEKWNCGSKRVHLSDGMRRPVSTGCDKLPMIDVLKAQRKGDRQCRRLGICRYTQTMEPPQFIPSREVARHGGRPAYRAHDADSQAWESALRTRGSLPEDPAQCVAATSSRVAKLPAEVLR